MSSNQYTQKSMEAIQNAQALAGEYGNQELSQLHLLAALTESADGLIPQLLTQMNVNASSLRAAVLSEIEKLPRVTGSAREAGKVYVTADMDKALREAAQEAARSGGGGGGQKKTTETDQQQVKNSLAQAVAAARGKTEAIPGGTAVYSYADKEQVRRIVGSDLPKYVELRSRVNGNTPASKLRQLREISVK